MKFTISDSVKNIPYYPKALMYGHEDGWVRLSSNENPYPPSSKVFETILDALFAVNRYPGGEKELKDDLAAHFDLAGDNFLIGNGSNELIEMSFRAMRHDTRNGVIVTESSFAFYEIAARIYAYEVKKVPLSNLTTDLDKIAGAIDEKTRIIFLNNPLNPTGTIYEDRDFENFIRSVPSDILIVVDEAYAEFAQSARIPRTLSYIKDYPVLIFRTFSKAYGLAGLRVGYSIGDPALVSFLERTKQPFSINLIAVLAARAALKDQARLKKVLDNSALAKSFYYEALKDMALEYIPSEANFVLIRIGDKAEEITRKLFEKKVLVRFMGSYGFPDCIRISFGTPAENKRCIEELKKLI
ncbi:MAG: histidinol-phosphate aminotransferase [Deltaproteobacteria bacterium]|nr:histidinol-phosphate aminotransferase [Deltaproteobacteria bacterium]